MREEVKGEVSHLMEEWEKFREEKAEEVSSSLTFDYCFQPQKKQVIAEAKLLWKFVLDCFWQRSLEVRAEFLKNFTSSTNLLVKTVAKLEFLPTSVFRHILWEYNIDFVSYESFLRRIKPEQIRAIADNYDDLFAHGTVPRCLGKEKTTAEKLLAEPLHSDKRYAKKAAISHNLMDLGFGFNAYPKGENDDTMQVEKNRLELAAKFLSEKNHADDFSTNTETKKGRYFRAYKKVRSNFVWFPNREVKLKPWVCPGFWYTLIMLAIFWLASPLISLHALSMFMGIYGHISWPWIIAAAVPGLLTPLWLTAAGFKLFGMGIYWLVIKTLPEERRDVISEWWEEHNCTKILKKIGVIVLCFVAGIVAAGVIMAIIVVWWELWVKFGHLETIFLTGGIICLLMWIIEFYDNKKLDAFLLVTGIDCFLATLATIVVNHWQAIISFMSVVVMAVLSAIITTALAVGGFFAQMWLAMGLFSLIALTPIFLMALIVVALCLPEKFQAMVDRFIDIVSLVMAVTSFIAIACFIVYAQSRFKIHFGISLWYVLGALIFMAILFLLARWLAIMTSPVLRSYKRIALETQSVIGRIGWLDHKVLVKNPWLRSLPVRERERMVFRIANVVSGIFCLSHFMYSDSVWLIPKINQELLEMLEMLRPDFIKLWNSDSSNYPLVFLTLKKVITGMGFEEAAARAALEIAKARQEEEARMARRRAFWLKITGPFVKVRLYAATLRHLWIRFNKLCPRNLEPEVLKIK